MKLSPVTGATLLPIQSSQCVKKTQIVLKTIENSSCNSSKSLFDQLQKISSHDEILDALIQGVQSESLKVERKTKELLDDLSVFVKTDQELQKILSQVESSFDPCDYRYLDHWVRLQAFYNLQTNPMFDKKYNPLNLVNFFKCHSSQSYHDQRIAQRILGILLLHHKDDIQETFQRLVSHMIKSDDPKKQRNAIKYLEILKRYNCRLEPQNFNKALGLLTIWLQRDNVSLFHVADQFIRRVFERGTKDEISACIPLLEKGCHEKNKPQFMVLQEHLKAIGYLKEDSEVDDCTMKFLEMKI